MAGGFVCVEVKLSMTGAYEVIEPDVITNLDNALSIYTILSNN